MTDSIIKERSSKLKIASWNVNSIRARLPHVLNWLDENRDIDVLCIQETKVKNEEFPADEFFLRGLKTYIHGQPAYNGVCFISRINLTNIKTGFNGEDLDGQARLITAEVEAGEHAGLKIINMYAPQGEEVDSPKFDFKRRFYAKVAEMFENEYSKDDKLLICGDYNICFDERDVYNVEKWQGRCMFTEEERSWLKRLTDFGLIDLLRQHTEEPAQYTWWDYRRGRFQRGEGLRIDHHLATPSVAASLKSVEIHKSERPKDRPSDHVPVVVEI